MQQATLDFDWPVQIIPRPNNVWAGGDVVVLPMARAADPSTSHAAAAQAREVQARHHRLILAALDEYGPAGKDAIAARIGLTGVAVARRAAELERAGLIRPTGFKVQSTAGRWEREWGLVR